MREIPYPFVVPVIFWGSSCRRVRRSQPWAIESARKRLVLFLRKSMCETAASLRAPSSAFLTQEELFGHIPSVGPSWEGMLIENILSSLPATSSFMVLSIFHLVRKLTSSSNSAPKTFGR